HGHGEGPRHPPRRSPRVVLDRARAAVRHPRPGVVRAGRRRHGTNLAARSGRPGPARRTLPDAAPCRRCHDRRARSSGRRRLFRRGTRMARASQVTAWVGWVWFAGIVLVTIGFFNAISGLVAVFPPKSLVGVSDAGIVVLDVSTWGWIHLLIGVLLVLTGFA